MANVNVCRATYQPAQFTGRWYLNHPSLFTNLAIDSSVDSCYNQ